MTKNTVVIPIDNTSFSLQILPYVQRFLDPAENKLVLLHVEPEPEGVHIDRPGFEPVDIPVDVAEAGERINFAEAMEPVIQPLRAAGFEVNVNMSFGKPAQAIERYLHYEPADLIALVTHGRSGLERLMLGSVAEHILRHVHTPLLLVHPENSELDDELALA